MSGPSPAPFTKASRNGRQDSEASQLESVGIGAGEIQPRRAADKSSAGWSGKIIRGATEFRNSLNPARPRVRQEGEISRRPEYDKLVRCEAPDSV